MRKQYKSALLLIAILAIALPNKNFVVKAETTAEAEIQASELEREKELIKELKLSIPEKTEDPNYPITFVDPSSKGVEVTVDDKTTTKAPSPFVLPNLSIGEHSISFKFTNAEGKPRYLSRTLLVTPKSPLFDQTLKTKIVRPNAIILQGTALPQASLMLIINSQFTHTISVSEDGKWEFIIPEPTEGMNNVIAFVIKNGIVSNPSKVFSFEYALQEEGNIVTTSKNNDPADKVTTFINNLISNIDQNRQSNPMLFYGVIGIAVLLILLLIEISIKRRKKKKQEEKTIASLFSTKSKESGSIIDVIQKDKKHDSKKEEKEDSKPKVKKAFDNLKKEMSEKDGKEEIVEKNNNEKPKKDKKGIFSLFKKRKKKEEKEADTKESKVETKETPLPQPEKTAEKETKNEEGKKEPVQFEEKGIKEEKKVETLKKEIESAEDKTKEDDSSNKKKAKASKKKKIKTKKEEVIIDDETEEPEKKVLTKEEFLKQFKNSSKEED